MCTDGCGESTKIFDHVTIGYHATPPHVGVRLLSVKKTKVFYNLRKQVPARLVLREG